jgi:hypothetical protein
VATTSDDKVLSRDFDIEVNTGTDESPEWTQIAGLDEDGIAYAETTREVDFMDADDGGFAKPVPFGRGYTITLKGSRIEDADTGDRDAGQAAVEAVMDEMGADALLSYRISSPAASGAETLEFKAWASVTPLGGSDTATWGAALKVYGEITRA